MHQKEPHYRSNGDRNGRTSSFSSCQSTCDERLLPRFVNFRLYSDLGLAYPPRQDFGMNCLSKWHLEQLTAKPFQHCLLCSLSLSLSTMLICLPVRTCTDISNALAQSGLESTVIRTTVVRHNRCAVYIAVELHSVGTYILMW